LVREFNLRPVAALVTHGHIDHMWSLFPLCNGYDIPGIVHQADQHLLSDPMVGISPETAQALAQLVGDEDIFAEPSDLQVLDSDVQLSIAGLEISTLHAPGHTAGSVMFQFADTHLFTGDVLFDGAIGRTDLPGGSPDAMNQTLSKVVLPLSDDLEVFPGHGPSTTMAIQRVRNPYLVRVATGGFV
jgi:glyoxylase-like metal-dependent hydrolase (beta-lactamase superfamily II)